MHGMAVETTPARSIAKTSDGTVLIRFDIETSCRPRFPNLILYENLGRNESQSRATRDLIRARFCRTSHVLLRKPLLTALHRLTALQGAATSMTALGQRRKSVSAVLRPIYPQERTSLRKSLTAALGQRRTQAPHNRYRFLEARQKSIDQTRVACSARISRA